MSVVIVTRNQYVIAERIHHITLDENKEYQDVRSPQGRNIGIVERYYNINIVYTPEASANNGRNDRAECNVKILGKIDAYKVYKDLIHQIREQMPDALFLNKTLENLLTDDDFLKMENQMPEDDFKLSSMEAKSDRRPKKARRARKTKRASKKVLRRLRKRR